jgi:hypothetical protein
MFVTGPPLPANPQRNRFFSSFVPQAGPMPSAFGVPRCMAATARCKPRQMIETGGIRSWRLCGRSVRPDGLTQSERPAVSLPGSRIRPVTQVAQFRVQTAPHGTRGAIAFRRI